MGFPVDGFVSTLSVVVVFMFVGVDVVVVIADSVDDVLLSVVVNRVSHTKDSSPSAAICNLVLI